MHIIRYKVVQDTVRTIDQLDAPSNLVWSNDGKTMAFNRSVSMDGKNDQKKQIFVINPDLNK